MGRPLVPFDDKYIPEPNSGCWLWTSGWEKKSYGQATGNKRAHRLSWEIHRGPIPEGMRVCHKCDTPPCVNPSHLFLGSDKDNVDDKMRKGRGSIGERNGKSKITDESARMIASDSRPAAVVATDFNVSAALVYHIRNGRIWSHATGRVFIERGAI